MQVTALPKTLGNITFSEEQNAIFAAFQDRGYGNIGVDAGAGTGKSATAKFAAMIAIPGKHSILFCAFNKTTRDGFTEFLKDLRDPETGMLKRNAYTKTFNGMGFAAAMKKLGVTMDKIDTDDGKYRKLAKEWAEKNIYSGPEIMPDDEDYRTDDDRDDAAEMLGKLINLYMLNTTYRKSGDRNPVIFLGNDEAGNQQFADHNPTRSFDLMPIRATAVRYDLNDLEHPEDEEKVYRAVEPLIRKGYDMMIKPDAKSGKHIMSFVEQIYWVVVCNWDMYQNYWVVVDEAQDLCPVERALVDKACWSDKGRVMGRIMAIGDPAQAIYAFKGADAHGFQNSMAFWNIKAPLTLSISRRCPKLISTMASGHKPGYRSTEDAPTGEVLRKNSDQLMEYMIPGETAIISRTRAELVFWFRKLTAAKIPAIILGGDASKAITDLIQRLMNKKGFTLRTIYTKLDELSAKKVKAMHKAQKSEQEVTAWFDLVEATRSAIETCIEGAKDGDELLSRIKAIFKTDEGDDRPKVAITTGHSAKGLEWKNVICVTPDKFPLVWQGQTPDQLEQELNLNYVMQTRTKMRLVFFDENAKSAEAAKPAPVKEFSFLDITIGC